jgi:hypothetical protein
MQIVVGRKLKVDQEAQVTLWDINRLTELDA